MKILCVFLKNLKIKIFLKVFFFFFQLKVFEDVHLARCSVDAVGQRQLHGRLPESSRQLVERSTLRGARGKPEQPGAAEPEAGEAEPPRRPESEPT